MHKIKFYPVGNGDTAQIILDNKKRILLDYRHQSSGERENTAVIDLANSLKDELKSENIDFFDVVAFTHLDKDHIQGSTDFFELRYAEKYKGKDRIKIKELWVPAALILESASIDEQSDEFIILRQEARYRLKEGFGIKVFSKPDELITWMDENDVQMRDELFVDAGQLVSTFSLDEDQVEFFCHSPFIKHCDENESKKEIRNRTALIFNVRFKYSNYLYDFLAVGDSEYDVLDDIVSISKYHNNEDRLKWNLFNLPHHCSYKALAPDGEKGEKTTVPSDGVKELLLSGQENAYMISSSHKIGSNNEAYEQIQPPHVQARNCYVKHLEEVNGRKLLVTMEESKVANPKPIEIEISSSGLRYSKALLAATVSTAASKPVRAGVTFDYV